jgi:hypothetical protein
LPLNDDVAVLLAFAFAYVVIAYQLVVAVMRRFSCDERFTLAVTRRPELLEPIDLAGDGSACAPLVNPTGEARLPRSARPASSLTAVARLLQAAGLKYSTMKAPAAASRKPT